MAQAAWVRKAVWPVWIALVGVVSLVCFVLVRAASFHGVDAFLWRRYGAMPLVKGLELLGIGCVAASACICRLRMGRPQVGVACSST